MENGTILIVDDNKSVLASLELLLENEFGTVRTAANPNQITTLLTTTSIDVVILDMNFSAGINNGNEGLYWLKQIHEIRPSLPVVMLTAYGDVELAVKALKNGATDFLLKPWDNQILIRKIKEAYKSNNSKAKSTSKTTGKQGDTEKPSKPEMMIGHSPAMLQLIKVVTKVAKTDANILITGENGTGKEMLAREIHRLSPRNSRQMLGIDMGAISESLFESELFGFEKGAFTDAKKSKAGRMEVATNGTLFLDEIGNLSLPMQSKLLTAIEKRQISRLGTTQAVPIDVRLICATNADIRRMVDEGSFRQDLLYRINTIEIHIPPLRERGNDIILLAEYFLDRYARKYKKEMRGLTREAKNKLLKYTWPGNVRELQHTMERVVILGDGSLLKPENFQFHVTPKQKKEEEIVLNLEQLERQTIEKAMKLSEGNISRAADYLGITRFALYRKLEKLGL